MPADNYDVVIVGARVAGASLALLLGQRGHRVLMVDRDRVPSDTLSTHYMHPEGVAHLARLGVLADVEAAGFRRLTRMRNYLDDCVFEGPNGLPGEYGLVPRRDCLDAVLIEHAIRRAGAELWQESHATGLLWDGGRVVGVRVRTAGADEREARARVVVGADGKYSKVAEWVGAAKYREVPAMRPAYYGYFHGVGPLAEPAIELFFGRNQIGFIFPMQPGVDCLALEVQPEDFEAFRADPRAVFERRFRALPGMAQRMEGAALEGKLQGTRGVANHFHQAYGPGWVLTGDAGCLKDPSTGAGMGDALTQSFLLGDALDAALSGADWEASLGEFQRQRDEALLPIFEGTIAFTRMPDATPDAMAWLRMMLGSPVLVRMLAAGLPGAIPHLFPPPMQTQLEASQRQFAAAAVAAPSRMARE